MLTYHCPHCGALMRHKPGLAGDRVICSKCGGQYFEPTDPLPGVKPQIAPPMEDDFTGEIPTSTPAPASTPPASTPSRTASFPPPASSRDASAPAAFRPPPLATAPRSTPRGGAPEGGAPERGAPERGAPEGGASQSAASHAGLGQCEPQDMVTELERRGLHALMIAWPPDSPEQAGLIFSPQLGREAADEMILKIALHQISARWPELHQLLMNYKNQLS